MKKNVKTVTRFYYFIACLFAITNYCTAQENYSTLIQPTKRVILDNDFSGDPDGLFALTHLLLSPSVDVRAIIGSHLNELDGFDHSKTQAQDAAKKAAEVIQLLHLTGKVQVIAGADKGMQNDSTPVNSKGVDFIIQEARKTDTQLPLYVLCGAGLTEVASAVLKAPDIASKFTLVWIGGPEYTDLAYPPPGYSTPEYNLAIDIFAAKVIFNKSNLNVWQVPRNAYRQAILPYSELLLKVKNEGMIGHYLDSNIEAVMQLLQQHNFKVGETYIIGDSPLVLLTALQSLFEPDASSSMYVLKQQPFITSEGTYAYNPNGKNIRVYNQLDINLMFNDFFAKLQLFSAKNKQ